MDMRVWTVDGPRLIAEVKSGDHVWSQVGRSLGVHPALRARPAGAATLYRVQTKNRLLRVTGDHLVLVRRPGSMGGGSNAARHAGLEWRPVAQLRPGDRAVQVQHLPDLGGAKLPDGELATQPSIQFLGAFIGDGCFNGDRGVRLCIPKTDRVRAHYEQLTQSLFTKHADRHYAHPNRRIRDGSTEQMLALRAQGWTQAAIAARVGLSRGSVQDRLRIATRTLASQRSPIVTAESRNGFQFWSTNAVDCLQRYGLVQGAKSKRVPGWVFRLRRELRLAFLAGLVDTDGSIDRRGTLKIQLAYRPLVEDVKALLVGCGIQTSNLYRQVFDAAVLPNPGRKDQYESWAIVSSSAEEVATIPFADSLYRTRVQANAGRRRRGGKDAAKAGLDDCLGFYTVRSIVPEGVEPVYDLEVGGGHALIADGLVQPRSSVGGSATGEALQVSHCFAGKDRRLAPHG
jgi:intein/homing endonuclease